MFIIPIFASMYDDLGGELPSLTQLMMTLSNLLKATGSSSSRPSSSWPGASSVSKHGRRTQDLGPYQAQAAHEGRPGGAETRGGAFHAHHGHAVQRRVPILQSIEITGKVSVTGVIEEAMVDVKESVRSGESISKPLSRVAVFPAW